MSRFFRRGYSALQQDDESKNFLQNTLPIRLRSVFFLANTLMFAFSSTVVLWWTHDRYFVLNNELRRTSTWSKSH